MDDLSLKIKILEHLRNKSVDLNSLQNFLQNDFDKGVLDELLRDELIKIKGLKKYVTLEDEKSKKLQIVLNYNKDKFEILRPNISTFYDNKYYNLTIYVTKEGIQYILNYEQKQLNQEMLEIVKRQEEAGKKQEKINEKSYFISVTIFILTIINLAIVLVNYFFPQSYELRLGLIDIPISASHGNVQLIFGAIGLVILFVFSLVFIAKVKDDAK